MPIKTEIMADRVATVDGHVYERQLLRNGSAVAIAPARRLTLRCRRSLNARNCAVTNCPHGLGVALQIWMVHATQKPFLSKKTIQIPWNTRTKRTSELKIPQRKG